MNNSEIVKEARDHARRDNGDFQGAMIFEKENGDLGELDWATIGYDVTNPKDILQDARVAFVGGGGNIEEIYNEDAIEKYLLDEEYVLLN